MTRKDSTAVPRSTYKEHFGRWQPSARGATSLGTPGVRGSSDGHGRMERASFGSTASTEFTPRHCYHEKSGSGQSVSSSAFCFTPESRKYGSWVGREKARERGSQRKTSRQTESSTPSSAYQTPLPSARQIESKVSQASRSTTRSQQMRDMKDIKMRISELSARRGANSRRGSTQSYASTGCDSLPLGCDWSTFYGPREEN